jgi:hypothetical protein
MVKLLNIFDYLKVSIIDVEIVFLQGNLLKICTQAFLKEFMKTKFVA